MDNNSIQHYRQHGLPPNLARVYHFIGNDLRFRRNNLLVHPTDDIQRLVQDLREERPLTQRGLYDHIKNVLGIGNISKGRIRQIYREDSHYQIHRPTKKNKSANTVRALGKGVFQIDLTYIPDTWRQGRGRRWKYACFLIDIFTRKLYGRLLRDKTQEAVLNAVNEMDVPIRALQSDNGLEFNSLRDSLIERDIPVYNSATYAPTTQGKIERLNKTFKSTIQHWLNQNIDDDGNVFNRNAFDNFIESYNDTYHNQIKMTPNESDARNVVRRRAAIVNFDEPVFAVGDRVRISMRILDDEYRRKLLIGHLKKSIEENWSFDIYTIRRINRSDNNKVETYSLNDPEGVALRRKFSPSDLLLAYN